MNIFVGNIAHALTEDELRAAFEQYGTVSTVQIIKDKYTGDSRGFGFVEMADLNEANAAIENLNGKELKGRPINVNEARPKEDNPPRRDHSQKKRFNRY